MGDDTRNFWDDLDDALRAKGLDPYTAKVTANHVRENFAHYATAFRDDANVTDSARKLFDRLFLGT